MEQYMENQQHVVLSQVNESLAKHAVYFPSTYKMI